MCLGVGPLQVPTGFLNYDLALPPVQHSQVQGLSFYHAVSRVSLRHPSCNAEPSSDLTETNSSSFTSDYPGFETAPAEPDCALTL